MRSIEICLDLRGIHDEAAEAFDKIAEEQNIAPLGDDDGAWPVVVIGASGNSYDATALGDAVMFTPKQKRTSEKVVIVGTAKE